MADQIPDPIDVIASEPDARHPMLDGAPVMIGDILFADHPDDYDHHIEFHVGSIMYDDGRDLGSEVDRGWTVSPINIEFGDFAPFEWPLSECKRVSDPGLRIVPVVDDATRQEVPEVLVTFAKWADWYLDDGCRRDHHGYCQSHGLDKDCPVGPMREWLAAYLGRTD